MDQVIRGTSCEGRVRIFISDVSATAAEICRRHQATPIAADALSRLIAVGAIMGIMQKYGRVNVRIEANGPLKALLVQANDRGQVRGYVANPQAEVSLNEQGQRQVGRAVGDLGVLTVIKELGMKQDFASQVTLQTGEIGEDFSYYFYTSEQIPSVVAVGTRIQENGSVAVAGAFLAQLMPGAEEGDIQVVESIAKNLPPLAGWLESGDYQHFETMDPSFVQLETKPISFHCSCSHERFVQGLTVLHNDELQEMIQAQHNQEVQCNFCGEKYVLTPDDLQEAFRRKNLA